MARYSPRCATDMPRDVADLWGFVSSPNHACLMTLLAHCASLAVNTVKLPWEQNQRHTHHRLSVTGRLAESDLAARQTAIGR
jgi:ParB family chromosome partitioning protein